MTRFDGANLLKRRLKDAGIFGNYSPHSFGATGITNYLEDGGTLEVAQRIAGHANSRTTKLYDRRGQKLLDGITIVKTWLLEFFCVFWSMFLRDHAWLPFTSSRASGQLSADLELAVILNLTGIKFYERFSTSTGSRRNARLVK